MRGFSESLIEFYCSNVSFFQHHCLIFRRTIFILFRETIVKCGYTLRNTIGVGFQLAIFFLN